VAKVVAKVMAKVVAKVVAKVAAKVVAKVVARGNPPGGNAFFPCHQDHHLLLGHHQLLYQRWWKSTFHQLIHHQRWW